MFKHVQPCPYRYCCSTCKLMHSWLQDVFPLIPWSAKHHKMAQPDMDYLAPEIQLGTAPFATPSCDMFSLGMLICSVYNGGKSLIQSSHNPASYTRQIDRVRIVAWQHGWLAQRSSFVSYAAIGFYS